MESNNKKMKEPFLAREKRERENVSISCIQNLWWLETRSKWQKLAVLFTQIMFLCLQTLNENAKK